MRHAPNIVEIELAPYANGRREVRTVRAKSTANTPNGISFTAAESRSSPDRFAMPPREARRMLREAVLPGGTRLGFAYAAYVLGTETVERDALLAAIGKG